MKKSINSILVLFCALAFNYLGAQPSATKPKAEFNPTITYKVQPNKLDKDGGELVITKDQIKKGVNLFKGLRKQRQQESAIATDPAPTAQPGHTTLASGEPTPASRKTSPPSEVSLPSPNSASTVDASYGGDWKMKVAIQEKYTNSGQRNDAPGNCEIGVSLKIDGQRITGDYTWAKGGVCGIAKIEGAMTGTTSFEAIITYTGGCCGGAKMKFTGNFTSKDTISGRFKPDGLPGAWCETWWATVKGERE